jgi:hypothetical protein
MPLVRPILVHYNSPPPRATSIHNSFKTMGGFLSKPIPFEGLSEKDTVIVWATLISVFQVDVKPRFLSVIGPSGSGKSTVSIVNPGASNALSLFTSYESS